LSLPLTFFSLIIVLHYFRSPRPVLFSRSCSCCTSELCISPQTKRHWKTRTKLVFISIIYFIYIVYDINLKSCFWKNFARTNKLWLYSFELKEFHKRNLFWISHLFSFCCLYIFLTYMLLNVLHVNQNWLEAQNFPRLLLCLLCCTRKACSAWRGF